MSTELLREPGTVSAAALLSELPPVLRVPDALDRIRAELVATGTRNIVLDDDPTGTQTVSAVPVLTSWSEDDLRWALDAGPGTCFVLTNTRSQGQDEAVRRNEQVVSHLLAAVDAAGAGVRARVISRCDSTLRGHYPLETDIQQARARAAGTPYDGVLLTPCYLEAGRLTVSDVHWVRQGEDLVPVARTEYARDATFGFTSADLRDFVVEKSGGRWSRADVVSLDLTTIRVGGPEGVRDVLLQVTGGRPVVVNAAADEDLEVVVLGLQLAERAGRRFLHRCGPSLVRVLGGLPRRPPLTHDEIYPAGPRSGHGLVVVGSHVGNSTRQLDELLALGQVEHVELDVPALLASDDAPAVVRALATRVRQALGTADVVLTTSRSLVTGGTPDASLALSRRVSRALVDVVAAVHADGPLRFVVAKGGITSSDIATAGLGIARATVLGQVLPGMVSVWSPVPTGGTDVTGLPFVVFAGNVGSPSALSDVVARLRGEG